MEVLRNTISLISNATLFTRRFARRRVGVAYQAVALLDELITVLGKKEVKDLVMVPNDQGDTGILAAVSRGGLESLRWVAKLFEGDEKGMGELVGKRNKNGTDLVQAAVGGRHVETVRMLVELLPKGRFGERMGNGMYPIHVAAERDCGGIVKLLVGAGARIEVTDKNGATPLMVASFVGAKEVVEVLLSEGADKEARDGEGRRAVDLAEAKKFGEIVEILK